MRLGKRERRMLRLAHGIDDKRHARMVAEDKLPRWHYETATYLRKFHGKPIRHWEYNAKGRGRAPVRIIE